MKGRVTFELVHTQTRPMGLPYMFTLGWCQAGLSGAAVRPVPDVSCLWNGWLGPCQDHFKQSTTRLYFILDRNYASRQKTKTKTRIAQRRRTTKRESVLPWGG